MSTVIAVKRDSTIYMGVPAERSTTEISYEVHKYPRVRCHTAFQTSLTPPLPPPQEQRTSDYLKSYQTVGKPPQPVPDTPSGKAERLALGLPPLFEPLVEVAGAGVALNLADLPEVQVFVPSRLEGSSSGPEADSGTAIYESISLQKEFCHFSFEVSVFLSDRVCCGEKEGEETDGSVGIGLS